MNPSIELCPWVIDMHVRTKMKSMHSDLVTSGKLEVIKTTMDMVAVRPFTVMNPRIQVNPGPWLMDIQRWMEIEDMVAGPSILVNPWMQPVAVNSRETVIETIGMDAGCPSIVVNAWIKMKLVMNPWVKMGVETQVMDQHSRYRCGVHFEGNESS
jgi:hypothetical protein